MSPLFELSETALNTVLFIGATTAFFMGLLGIVNNDIKRVIAYSTLSQLGYMTVGLGASAYSGAIFHLMTHAFFKALLFLAAGSVIIGMHHEQDMRKMGGLKQYMPITYWTALIGSVALIAVPGTSGFFSKDILIEAVHESHLTMATYAYWSVLLGVFVTAFYSFRLVFMTFHGPERFGAGHHGHGDHHGDDHHGHDHQPHESPWVVTLPLILLAIPSLIIGWITVEPVLFGNYFGNAITVLPAHDVLGRVKGEFHGPAQFVLHAFTGPAVYLAAAGVLSAWYLYLKKPELPAQIASRVSPLYKLLANKFYVDELYQAVFAGGSRGLGTALWRVGDVALIDGGMVNGSARVVGWLSGLLRHMQSGYLYHYAFAMIIGLSVLLAWYVLR
jgi:NADH-quinone oxidoreductase subunit L